MELSVYKQNEFLVFDFINKNKTVKYDFKNKQAIGFSGKPVKNINRQLSNINIQDVIDNCKDKRYADFLSFIIQRTFIDEEVNISNIGTILQKVPEYSKYEQLFSAGIDFDRYFKYKINEIPKSLIKISRKENIRLNNKLVYNYKKNLDAFNLAFNLKYISLTSKDIAEILIAPSYGDYICRDSCFSILVNKFDYNTKSLMNYIDYLNTFEGLENSNDIIMELLDYNNMMSKVSKKYDKYPKNFLTTHHIACRTFNRFQEEYSEELFKKRINTDLEFEYGNYSFIYPKCVQDIKDEACMQSNCVASYVQKIIDGKCDVMFMRNKNDIANSLVTLEIQNNKIVQAKGKYNREVTDNEAQAIEKWNQHFKK